MAVMVGLGQKINSNNSVLIPSEGGMRTQIDLICR